MEPALLEVKAALQTQSTRMVSRTLAKLWKQRTINLKRMSSTLAKFDLHTLFIRFSRTGVHKVILFMTDGVPNPPEEEARAQTSALVRTHNMTGSLPPNSDNVID